MTPALGAPMPCHTSPDRPEWNEARAYAVLMQGAREPERECWGLSVDVVGPCVVLSAARFTQALVLNRAFGLGLGESADLDQVDHIERHYLDRGVRSFAIELSPAAQPTEIGSLLVARGYLPFTRTTLMVRGTHEPLPAARAAPGVNVRRAKRDNATTWSELCGQVFRFGGPLPGLLRTSFDDETWHHWLAEIDDVPAGAGVTHVVGDVAWIGWVCTLPMFRGRGVQAALTAAQIEDARLAGASQVSLEAVSGSPGRPAQSLRNYERAGFHALNERVAYLRRVAVPS